MGEPEGMGHGAGRGGGLCAGAFGRGLCGGGGGVRAGQSAFGRCLGGGRPGPDLAGLDGALTCHWRILPLFFARESDHAVAVMEQIAADKRIERVLRHYAPFKKMLYKGEGRQVRALFDRADLPRKEQAIRNAIKRAGLWTR